MRTLTSDGQVHVVFVAASSKITPKAATTVPRLELCGALEATRFLSNVLKDLRRKPDKVYMYTDSNIVLGYLRNDDRRFAMYVERRKEAILSVTSKSDWFYVATDQNPADLCSRPTNPTDLLRTSWISGPEVLKDPCYEPCSTSEPDPPSELPEQRVDAVVLHTREVPACDSVFSGLFSRISRLSRLIGIVQCIHRFIRKFDPVRDRLGFRTDARHLELTREEALLQLVKVAQEERYSDSIKALGAGSNLPEHHRISHLSPRLDSSGIVRVGGRLKHSPLTFDQKHPMLLPKAHTLSKAFAMFYHERSKHQGTLISHSTVIQAGYHIEGGRQLIKALVKVCIICRKLRGKCCKQQMADLPPERVEATPVFSHVAIDAFGPFYFVDGKNTRRSSASKKIWALIFVCMPSRAVHLEPLHGMDVSSFRNAFLRFTSMRGGVDSIFSDKGTNFTCARRQMSESTNLQDVAKALVAENVNWKLNPTQASHHAGHVERKIGLVRKVFEASLLLLHNRPLSRDEFYTFLAESAAIVNNTPLWPCSDDPNDPRPLSPAMLMTLKETPNPPSVETFTEEDILAYGPRRYRRVQALSEHFWHRWSKEYLVTLNARHKWRKVHPCVSVGDLVLVKTKNVPRNSWQTGRVSAVHEGLDGLVRSVSLILPPLPGGTKTRSTDRAITDLVLLLPSSSHKCDK